MSKNICITSLNLNGNQLLYVDRAVLYFLKIFIKLNAFFYLTTPWFENSLIKIVFINSNEVFIHFKNLPAKPVFISHYTSNFTCPYKGNIDLPINLMKRN